MIGELLCPECGGVVGASEQTEAGPPCSCFRAPPDDATDELEPPPPPAPVVKVCRLCAKDLAGHRRVKDSAGYLCYDCAKAEEKRELGGRVRCPQCGHLTSEQGLIQSDGKRVCGKCYGERQKLKKQRLKGIGFTGARTRYELARLYILGGILALLLLVIFISRMWTHSR